MSVKIDNLCGAAYESAIKNIISHVNKLGWNWTYYENWREAERFAEENNFSFDVNGEFV